MESLIERSMVFAERDPGPRFSGRRDQKPAKIL